MTKVYQQSKRRYILYSAGVFVCSALAFFAVGAISIGGIHALGIKGALSVVAAAVGITILYFLAMLYLRGDDKVIVEDSIAGETYMRVGKKMFFLDSLCRTERHTGILGRIFHTEKVCLFFSEGASVCFVFPRSVSEEFTKLLPRPLSGEADRFVIRSGNSKYFIFLSDLINIVAIAVIVALTALPALFAYLGTYEKIFSFSIGYCSLILLAFLVSFLFRSYFFFSHAGFAAYILEDRLVVSCGEKAGILSEIMKSDFAGMEIRQSFFEKIVGLYRLKIILFDAVNGGEESSILFPFLLKRKDVQQIAMVLNPDFDLDQEVSRGKAKNFMPYLQYLAIPALIVFCLSFYINFYLLLLESDFILFGVLLYLRKGYRAHKTFADIRCGVFMERRVFLPYTSIQRVTGKKNPIAHSQKVIAPEISLGKYSDAYFCGYISEAEFWNLIEKVGK